RHWTKLHHPFHALGMFFGVQHHHHSQVGITDGAEALYAEMGANGFKVAHVFLDVDLRHVLHRIGAAAIAHVVEDQGSSFGELAKIFGQEKPCRDDDGWLAITNFLIEEACAIGGGNVSFIRLTRLVWLAFPGWAAYCNYRKASGKNRVSPKSH